MSTSPVQLGSEEYRRDAASPGTAQLPKYAWLLENKICVGTQSCLDSAVEKVLANKKL